jgi:hypothetical protein
MTAAAATTAAATSSTATPITTCVDRRHRAGRMYLLGSGGLPRATRECRISLVYAWAASSPDDPKHM